MVLTKCGKKNINKSLTFFSYQRKKKEIENEYLNEIIKVDNENRELNVCTLKK